MSPVSCIDLQQIYKRALSNEVFEKGKECAKSIITTCQISIFDIPSVSRYLVEIHWIL